MAADGMMRASDADRDAVVDVLRDAFTAGRLTLDEFDERTSAAYASRTWGELRELTVDLPVQPALGADVPGALVPPGFRVDQGAAQDADQHAVRHAGQDADEDPGGPGPEPANLPPGYPSRRPRPAGSVMPFVMVWFLLMIAAHSAAAIVAPAVVVTVLLLVIAISRRK